MDLCKSTHKDGPAVALHKVRVGARSCDYSCGAVTRCDVSFLGNSCLYRPGRHGRQGGTQQHLWWTLLLQGCGGKYADMAKISTGLADDLAGLRID